MSSGKAKQPQQQPRQRPRRRARGFKLPADAYPSLEPSKPKFLTGRVPYTDEGTSWLKTYLNPNGHHESQASRGKVPDGSASKTGLLNFHIQKTWTNPFTDGDSWSLFIVSTNLLAVQHLLVASKSGADELTVAETESIGRFVNDGHFGPANTQLNLNKWLKVSDNIQIYLKTPPELQEYAYGSYASSTTRDFSDTFIRVRQTYKGDTYRFTGSALYNQGTCTVAKYPSDSDYIMTTTNIPQEPPTEGDAVDRGDIYRDGARKLYGTLNRFNFVQFAPLSARTLTAADIKAYTGAVRDGAYSVNYNTSETFHWMPAACARGILYGTSLRPTLDVQDTWSSFVDIIDNNWEVGVAIFAGLHPGASIQQDTRSGLEYQAVPDSIYASQQEPAPRYDPTPIALSKIVKLDLKSGYPASYNDWGKLWNVIKGIIPSALGLIPGVGPILAGMAPTVMTGVGQLISKFKKR